MQLTRWIVCRIDHFSRKYKMRIISKFKGQDACQLSRSNVNHRLTTELKVDRLRKKSENSRWKAFKPAATKDFRVLANAFDPKQVCSCKDHSTSSLEVVAACAPVNQCERAYCLHLVVPKNNFFQCYPDRNQSRLLFRAAYRRRAANDFYERVYMQSTSTDL